MKFQTCVELLKENGCYAGDIKYDLNGQFIGMVYAKNFKYESDEDRDHFSTPINCSQYDENPFGENIVWFLNELASHAEHFGSSCADDGFDVYGESVDGTEGSANIDIGKLAKAAADYIEKIEK